MEKVIIRRCEEYDRGAIEKIVSEGMAEAGYKPKGKVFVKPNVVYAGPKAMLGIDACTPAAFVGASLLAVSKSPEVARVDLGEKSAVGFPTRNCYKHAGYYAEMKIVKSQAPKPVGIFCMDEDLRDSVFVGGSVHSNLRISRKMARADSKVYLPKLKCHCVTNITGAVKLNVGICSDDERSIRHDFLLNEKIVDLLAAGYPDFVAMDAIDIGVGNEAYPKLRKLGLILMGTNPVAVDIVGARLLGFGIDQIPYLKLAIQRGYTPASLDDIKLVGDITTVAGLDEQAKRVMPYDDDYYSWQNVGKELKRLNSPMRFYWGPYSGGRGDKCLYGCVMGIKMFLASYERYAGAAAFATAKPVVFAIGKVDEEIDAKGADAFLLGSCVKAKVINAKKIYHIDKCFTTATDMAMVMGHRIGIPTPTTNMKALLPLLGDIAIASMRKIITFRYLQDFGHFLSKNLIKKI